MGRHKFKVGQRVRPSDLGIAELVFIRTKVSLGVVTRVDKYNSPTVLWDNRKTTSKYHPSFISHAKPRRATPAQLEG